MRLAEAGEHVEEQRLALGPGFLRPVEDGDRLHRRRQGGDELGGRERAVQPDLEDADPLSVGSQVPDGLPGGDPARAHDDDDPGGFGVPGVLDQPVGTPGALGEGVHGLLHDSAEAGVVRVHGLAGLEVDVGVLRGPADERVLGRQRAGAVLAHELLGHEGAEDVVVEPLHGGDLVRGAEPVEEVQERHPAAQGGRLGDEREVVRLLHRRRRQQGEAGLAHGHDVGVVAEDGQALGGERPGGDVEHRRGELPGDLVHVGDHEQQALRRRVGRAERAALQRAVHRPRGAALALHLDHRRDASPDVGTAGARPLVGELGHRRARGDRVDGAQLVEPVGDVDRRLVAVDGAAHASDLRDGDDRRATAAGALRRPLDGTW